jgi:hypothetical protein
MGTTSIGLAQLRMGAVANDGGMGTALTVLSSTVVDTAVLTNEAPTETDFPIEEQDDPIYSTSVAGKRTIAWSTYDVTPDALVRVLGGTVTVDGSGNNVYNAPINTPQLYVSIELTTLEGDVVRLVKVKINSVIEWNFQKSKLAQVNITGTILKPDKANTPPLTITKKAV